MCAELPIVVSRTRSCETCRTPVATALNLKSSFTSLNSVVDTESSTNKYNKVKKCIGVYMRNHM